MPYSKSRARDDFEQNFTNLISLARQISYKKVELSYDHKNMIFQSSIVLLCSSIEEYLKVSIEDLFFRYRARGANLAQIHINPRTYSLFQNQKSVYESFIQSGDEVRILQRLNVNNKNMYSVIDDSETFVNHVDSRILLDKKKYPSPKNLKILFNRIGVQNIFHETNRIGRKDYELILRSFLDIRETIAHQSSINLTFQDVKRNFDNVKDLIDKLDRILFSYVCRTSGQNYWK